VPKAEPTTHYYLTPETLRALTPDEDLVRVCPRHGDLGLISLRSFVSKTGRVSPVGCTEAGCLEECRIRPHSGLRGAGADRTGDPMPWRGPATVGSCLTRLQLERARARGPSMGKMVEALIEDGREVCEVLALLDERIRRLEIWATRDGWIPNNPTT
jgi:hypothetical protein